MKNVTAQRALAVLLLLIAVVWLLAGGSRVHKVYDADADEWGGIRTFQKISERELVEDATFTGVVRKGNELQSTYDRSKPKGKRLCPT